MLSEAEAEGAEVRFFVMGARSALDGSGVLGFSLCPAYPASPRALAFEGDR